MPDSTHEGGPEGARGRRVFWGLLIGLVGSILIWLATPYSNFVIGSSYIADSYLPIAALFVTLLLILGVNPLLRRFRPGWSLGRSQMALASGMMFVACVLPGQGLLRMLPYAIANVPLEVRGNKQLADGFKAMDLPPSLFPDTIRYGADTPVSQHFVTELPHGDSIPWAAWVPPLLSWGTFLLFCWLMMIGLALIVLPQWRRNERLPFPLLTVQQELVAEPEPGRYLPPLFRKRSFWVAAGIVLVLHVLSGLKQYNPEGIPAIPLNWNLSRLFTEEPLVYLPGHIRANRIYFIFLGVAFFMPSRIGFSVWFFVVAYAAYVVVGRAYVPPFYYSTIPDHRMGGMLILTLGVLWLGRAHWAHVFRCLFRRPKDDVERRDRRGGLMFAAGCAGMFGWLCWVGVQPLWALCFVGFGFMVSLLITRIVAETGMPFIRIDCGYHISLIKLLPISLVGPVALYFGPVMAMLFPTASRVGCATMATHALELDRKTTPSRQANIAVMLVGLLLIGLVVCGASHLHASYNHSMTLDGREQPINPWGVGWLKGANRDLVRWQSGQLNRPVYNQAGHIVFGAALAGALHWACLAMPQWPLHPIGLLMVHTFYSNEAWVSVFLGWLIKIALLRYGGSRLYRAAIPAILGLVMGEVFAAVLWALVPAVLVFLEQPYFPIQIQPY